MPSYSPHSIKGMALGEVNLSLVEKDVVELAPGFYSWLFVVWKTSGSWWLVIDLSLLNCLEDSIQDGDPCFGSLVGSPRRLDGLPRPQGGLLAGSHPFGQAQVPEVCGLQQGVPVSCALLWPLDRTTGVHQGYGSFLLDSPWSGSSPSLPFGRLAHPGFVSRGRPLLAGDCRPLPLSRVGHRSQPAKSNFVPAQHVQYLGTVLDSVSSRASPSQQRVEKLLTTGEEFLSSRLQPASTWQVLLGVLSSRSHLVPPGASACGRSS